MKNYNKTHSPSECESGRTSLCVCVCVCVCLGVYFFLNFFLFLLVSTQKETKN